MLRKLFFSVGLCSALFGFLAVAEEAAQPAEELETLMCERGKLLLSDNFNKGPAKAWRVLKGKWETADGATRGAELKADMHGAVIRANLPFRNAVIQYSFMLQGAKTTTFSINDAKGHNSRVVINAGGFTARKDDHDHAGPDQAVVLQRVKRPISEGRWHTLVIEVNGPEFLARLDEKPIAFGSHPAIDVDKTNVGLTVGGESVSFKNLRVWEASPKPGWPEAKANLLPQQKK